MERQKHTIDATDRPLGRLATEIATLLRGKHKPEFQPHLDQGDIVEVTNVDKIKFTGKKMEQKKYYRHSGHPGNLKEESFPRSQPPSRPPLGSTGEKGICICTEK